MVDRHLRRGGDRGAGVVQAGTRELWRPGDKIYVKSPMAMLNQGLSLRTVTFTQDSEFGTRTTLDLVAPWQLLDESDAGAGASGVVPANPLGAEPSADVRSECRARPAWHT